MFETKSSRLWLITCIIAGLTFSITAILIGTNEKVDMPTSSRIIMCLCIVTAFFVGMAVMQQSHQKNKYGVM